MVHSLTMLNLNPYKSPESEENIVLAEIVDHRPIPPERNVLGTIAGVAMTIGAVLGLDGVVKGNLPRIAILAAAGVSLAYSAKLSDPKEISPA